MGVGVGWVGVRWEWGACRVDVAGCWQWAGGMGLQGSTREAAGAAGRGCGLDAGCGCGRHARAVAAAYEVEGDREREAAARNQQDRLQLLAGVQLSQGTGAGAIVGRSRDAG